MDYDKYYRENKAVFGSEPNDMLKQYYHQIQPRGKILDIGAGQGRNSFFLVQKGFQVTAIDPSQTAVDIIKNVSKQEGYSIKVYNSGFEDFHPEAQYSAILVFGLLQMLPWDKIDYLIESVKYWVESGALIFLTAWSISDPRFEYIRKNWQKRGNNSFGDHEGNIITYLEENQVLKLFSDFAIVYHWEGLGPWHQHGNSEPERHGSVKAIFKK